MTTYTPAQLTEILARHAQWLKGDPSGVRANLARADLTDANLTGANLTDADLTDADLTDAYLTRADLTRADLTRADLTRADLAGANLTGANLTRADLAGANLTDANLTGANLTVADLTDADLTGANLTRADLTRADLTDADLTDANLTGANLARARNPPSGTEQKDPPEPYKRATTDEERAARRAKRAAEYRERRPDVPVIERLDARILEIVESGKGLLRMSDWHHGDVCGTTHCRAGWAIHLAGEKGAELERQHGPAVAGGMIYRASTGRIPHFYATDEAALEDIRRCASEESK